MKVKIYKEFSFYIYLRLGLLFTVLISTTFYMQAGTIALSNSISIYYLIFFSFLMTTFFVLLFDHIKNIQSFLYSQIAYDIIFTTALLYKSESFDQYYVIFYFINIIFSALVAQGRGALVTSILSSTLYILVVISKQELSVAFRSPQLVMLPTAMLAMALLSGQMVEELKKGRHKISQLEKISKEIVESLDSGLINLNKDGKILAANLSGLQILQIKSELEIIDKNISQIIPEFENINFTQVKEVRTGEKNKKILVSSIALLEDQRMIIFRDITDILELEEKYRRQEKLAGIGRLAAGVAHEIRNPIASISGAAQILKDEALEDKDESKKLLGIITKESERVSGLVDKLLNYAKPSVLTKENIDVVHLIKDCVASISTRDDFRNANIKLKINLPEHHLANVNADQLREVVNNLLVNSVQSFSDSKKIKEIEIKLKNENGKINLTITDSGSGISKEIRNRVFDPFFTTKSTGTGLGLSQVHKIVTDHGGSIELTSDANTGTRFTITLPG